jgi:hypothetical protein
MAAAVDRPTLQRLKGLGVLPEADLDLLHLIIERGVPARRIARILGWPGYRVTRRVSCLARRLKDPVVVAMLNYPCSFPKVQQQVVLRRLMTRDGVRRIARSRGLSARSVCAMVHEARGWARGMVEASMIRIRGKGDAERHRAA